MKFTVSPSGLPVGSYGAKFIAAEPITNDFGDGVTLKFEVLSGDHTGETATRICSTKLSPKSNLFKFIQALKGTKPEAGEEIDLLSYVGTAGMIVVEETDSGSTRVGSFIRMG